MSFSPVDMSRTRHQVGAVLRITMLAIADTYSLRLSLAIVAGDGNIESERRQQLPGSSAFEESSYLPPAASTGAPEPSQWAASRLRPAAWLWHRQRPSTEPRGPGSPLQPPVTRPRCQHTAITSSSPSNPSQRSPHSLWTPNDMKLLISQPPIF